MTPPTNTKAPGMRAGGNRTLLGASQQPTTKETAPSLPQNHTESTPRADRDGTRFAMIPHWILHHRNLTGNAKALYGVLMTYADRDTLTAFPSQSTIAALMGVSARHVRTLLSGLESAGAIRRKQRARETSGARASNLYMLAFERPFSTPSNGTENRDIPEAPRNHSSAPPGTAVPHPPEPEFLLTRTKELELRELDPLLPPTPQSTGIDSVPGATERVSPSDIEDDFAEWYAAYPRKRGKGQALKAYRAARKKVDAATLLEAIEAQGPALLARGSQYCPYPATWLNGQRWADDLDEVAPSQPSQPNRVQENIAVVRAMWEAEQAWYSAQPVPLPPAPRPIGSGPPPPPF